MAQGGGAFHNEVHERDRSGTRRELSFKVAAGRAGESLAALAQVGFDGREVSIAARQCGLEGQRRGTHLGQRLQHGVPRGRVLHRLLLRGQGVFHLAGEWLQIGERGQREAPARRPHMEQQPVDEEERPALMECGVVRPAGLAQHARAVLESRRGRLVSTHFLQRLQAGVERDHRGFEHGRGHFGVALGVVDELRARPGETAVGFPREVVETIWRGLAGGHGAGESGHLVGERAVHSAGSAMCMCAPVL